MEISFAWAFSTREESEPDWKEIPLSTRPHERHRLKVTYAILQLFNSNPQ